MRVSRVGDRGFGPSLKHHKNIGLLSNTGPDPLKIHKATKLAFKCWAIIDIPAKVHLDGVLLVGLLLVVFGSSLPSSTLKKTSELDPPPLTKLSGSVHGDLYLIFKVFTFMVKVIT